MLPSSTSSTPPILRVSGLSVSFGDEKGVLTGVLDNVCLSLGRGEILAIVGESGSGKSTIARSIMGLLPPGGQVTSGLIELDGHDLRRLGTPEQRRIRGREIGMIFQEPAMSLNPALKIGFQLCEAILQQTSASTSEAQARAVQLLTRAQFPNPKVALDKYPHEFSGGMCQRIMIASSLMMQPRILIADEPTTALDCLVQKEVMEILMGAARSEGTAILLISHDIALVARYADSIAIINGGRIVEQGAVARILRAADHPYTRTLLSALQVSPRAAEPPKNQARICEVRNLSVDYPVRRKWFWERQRYTPVLHRIDLEVMAGETLAVVGESGSGKTTLGRAILQLVKPSGGSIRINGVPVTAHAPKFRTMSSVVQVIFQDPYAALSPRRTVAETVAEPLFLNKALSRSAIQEKMLEMLHDVGLDEALASRYPHELSGGQRQRASIARALIVEPKLVIADEPVSSLDVTVRAQILLLLQRLKATRGFACLFISHDLGVVEQIADRVAVMRNGRIVECCPADELFRRPGHAYTRELLHALPRLKQTGAGSYAIDVHEPDKD